ncbi:MAG: glycerol-3-phosphate dehydrogenase [Lachnospiraceae bacterium]|nr:glycerol-3-phosphate dehydrogenase [Lachnospiraceae bacterium]
MERLMEERKNEFLTLPDSVILTTDLQHLPASEMIVISINSQGLRSLMNELKNYPVQNKIFVLCMKGIEISTGYRLSQIVEETLPQSKVAVWLGPGHVQDFYNHIPNCMVIDSNHEELKKQLVSAFSSDLIRFYYGQDMLGNEIGAAAKNVIGIAAGMLDGLSLSSLKGALMSRGTREIARMIKAMGGNELSAYGLCHLGDYEATVFSGHSHNRQFGESFVKGEDFPLLAEGYYTVHALVKLGKEHHTELPICDAVYSILYENQDAKQTLGALFTRSLKNEFSEL